VLEVLLILFHAAGELPNVPPAQGPYAGWSRAGVAAAMLSPEGCRKVCARMRFDPGDRCYAVAYSYCEPFFTRAVRNYAARRRYADHRALFALAPQVALLVFLFLIFPWLGFYFGPGANAVLHVLFAAAAAALAGVLVYSVGSIQYTREHHDRLIKDYYNRVAVLSRFPEAAPNPMLKLDLDGNVLYANPAALKLHAEAGLAAKPIESILPGDYKGLVVHCLEEDPRKHEADVAVNGRVLHYVFSPFTDERSVIAAGTDVTYLKEIEDELRDLNQNLEAKVHERTWELQETQDVTILCLAGLAEIRDPETGEHLQRTRLYVRLLAEHLRDHPRFRDHLNDKTIEMIYKSTPLHDIGKVGVPDSVLRKPGPLSTQEFEEEMKKHPLYGGDALRWAEERLGFDSFLHYAREIAYYHHEWWDGTGYPRGLKGEAIPVAARLMALADVYDALTTARVYKEAYPHEKAKAMILDGRGTHFDPAVVDAFLDVEDEFIRIAKAYKDSALRAGLSRTVAGAQTKGARDTEEAYHAVHGLDR